MSTNSIHREENTIFLIIIYSFHLPTQKKIQYVFTKCISFHFINRITVIEYFTTVIKVLLIMLFQPVYILWSYFM